jgi:acetyltransferase-like isoleucine patch superfamily enzyme
VEWAKAMLKMGVPAPRCVRPVIRGLYRAGVWCVEGSALIRKVFWIEPVLRSVCVSVGRGLRVERLPYMRGDGSLALGDRVNLSGRSCFYFMSGMPAEPEIAIGSDTFVGNGCTFSSAQSIRVGSHCLISAGVRIHDNDGHPLDSDRRRRGERIVPAEVAAVNIGNNVWIGAEAVVLKGVRIGDNAVVGTRAVVTHDVPEGAVVAGNPARALSRP